MKPYYDSDGITIYHGDCRDVLPSLPKVDLVLTDPPFLILFGTTESKAELGNYTILEGWFNDQLRLWKPLIKPAGNMIIFCDWRTYPSFWRVSLQNHIIPRNMVVWIHNAARHWHLFRYCHQLALVAQQPPTAICDVPEGKRFDYWIENNVPTLAREHPTEKPIDYLMYLIQASTKTDDLILDPFMGSGTTLRAAKDLGRKAIGIEIEEKYCEIAARRMSQSVFAFTTEAECLNSDTKAAGEPGIETS